MTSNMGSHIIQENFAKLDEKNKYGVMETTRIEVMELLRKTIRPEFLNRIDEIIMFAPLMKDEITGIVKIQIDGLKKMLEKNNIHIEVTDKAVTTLADMGFDPQFGARPLKRVIQKEIVNELSKKILAGTVSSESHIIIDTDKNGELIFKNRKKELVS